MFFLLTGLIPFAVALYTKNYEEILGQFFPDTSFNIYHSMILQNKTPFEYIERSIIIVSIMTAMAGLASEYIFSQNNDLATWKKAYQFYNIVPENIAGDTEEVNFQFIKYMKKTAEHYHNIKTKNKKFNLLKNIKTPAIKPLFKFFSDLTIKTSDYDYKITENYEKNGFSYLEPLYEVAIRILNENRFLIEEVAEQLTLKGTLDNKDLKEIFENRDNVAKKWQNRKKVYEKGIFLVPQESDWDSRYDLSEQLNNELIRYKANNTNFFNYNSLQAEEFRKKIKFIDDPVVNEYVHIPMSPIPEKPSIEQFKPHTDISKDLYTPSKKNFSAQKKSSILHRLWQWLKSKVNDK